VSLVWVCGPRDLVLTSYQCDVLAYTLRWMAATRVAHGCARGIDSTAGAVAQAMRLPVIERPADWNAHGKRAGILRNEELARLTHENGGQCLAVFRFPEPSTGTADGINRARAYRLPLYKLMVMRGDEAMIFRADSNTPR
jgi:hypothetical protein